MKRSRRLDTVARIAARRERRAAEALAASDRRLEVQQRSERLLDEARDRNRAGLTDALSGGSVGYRLKLLAQSIQNLERGLGVVAQKLDAARADREAKLRDWLRSQSRTKAIHEVADRHRAEESADAERNDQHELDDRSARLAVHRRDRLL